MGIGRASPEWRVFLELFKEKKRKRKRKDSFPFVWKVASRDFLGGPAVKPGLPMQGAPWPETKIPSADHMSTGVTEKKKKALTYNFTKGTKSLLGHYNTLSM